MNYKGILVLAGMALMASPAAAAEQSAKARGQEKAYCFKYATDTGSRISRLECRTKKEWARLGVDVDELLGK